MTSQDRSTDAATIGAHDAEQIERAGRDHVGKEDSTRSGWTTRTTATVHIRYLGSVGRGVARRFAGDRPVVLISGLLRCS
jgi:hypothetical protein